jgi:hypothetical protein
MVFSKCTELGVQFKYNPTLHNSVYHNDTKIAELSGNVSMNTLLHEAIHAVTTYYIQHEDK